MLSDNLDFHSRPTRPFVRFTVSVPKYLKQGIPLEIVEGFLDVSLEDDAGRTPFRCLVDGVLDGGASVKQLGPRQATALAATVVWNMGNKAGKEHTGPEFGEGGKEANWAGLGPL